MTVVSSQCLRSCNRSGFQAGNFNPNFGGGFQGNPQMGNDQGAWNPHGAKRTRQE